MTDYPSDLTDEQVAARKDAAASPRPAPNSSARRRPRAASPRAPSARTPAGPTPPDQRGQHVSKGETGCVPVGRSAPRCRLWFWLTLRGSRRTSAPSPSTRGRHGPRGSACSWRRPSAAGLSTATTIRSRERGCASATTGRCRGAASSRAPSPRPGDDAIGGRVRASRALAGHAHRSPS